VAAIIHDQIADHGTNAHSPKIYFINDLGVGVELQIWRRSSFPIGLMWKTLQKVATGLWLYMIRGENSHRARFCYMSRPNDFELGYGVIRQSRTMSRRTAKRGLSTPLGSTNSAKDITPNLSNPNIRDSDTLNSSELTANNNLGLSCHPWHFHVPYTDMTLSITAKSPSIGFALMNSILDTAHNQIVSEIATQGWDTSIARSSFRYRDSSSAIVLEVVNSRIPPEKITWGQVATVVRGLGWFVNNREFYRSCYFTAYVGEPEVEIGFGRIAQGLVLPSHNSTATLSSDLATPALTSR